jgi:hypothetical protein
MPTLSGTPMAASTGESCTLPAWHAEPVEAATLLRRDLSPTRDTCRGRVQLRLPIGAAIALPRLGKMLRLRGDT